MKYVTSAENIKYSTVRHNLLHHRSIVLDHMILVTLSWSCCYGQKTFYSVDKQSPAIPVLLSSASPSQADRAPHSGEQEENYFKPFQSNYPSVVNHHSSPTFSQSYTQEELRH